VRKQESIDGAIKVKLLFFGPLAEKLNQRSIELSLLYGTTINQIIDRFELKSMISDGLVVALDGDIGVDLDTEVKDSSEIAFLPPVSGG
jgi:molybdopterin converting factor small subunit|tara:strand:- start:285 stop:551 length:267 start_codon:yes stop_codon:yes gene_type:complete